ncbi:MAG: hypothetical protein LBL97_00550 [Prevotellaceae bacterium]|jgi:AraC-like DNA-binding protein|nr:hypothetical protein [Prevotellaceae bacterium]
MDKEQIVALVCSLCVVSFLVATVLCLQHYLTLGKERPRSHIWCLVIAYTFSVLAYGSVTIRSINVAWAVYLHPLYILFFAYAVIFSYKFIYMITQTGSPRRFDRWNYIVPVLLAVGFWGWSNRIPYEERCRLMSAPDIISWDTPFIHNAYMLLPLLCSVYILGYGIAIYPYIRRYRAMIIDYSANEERTSLGWLYADYAMIMASALLPVARLSYYWGFNNLMYLYPVIVAVWVILVSYNAIKGSYVLVPLLAPEEPAAVDGKSLPRGLRLIDRRQFEQYMEEHKPYLNPDLCITDMVLDLCTNRTYLSNYINQEYGVNFKTLINGYRLRELERLQQQQADKKKGKKGTMDLVLEAGFGSYRSYLSSSKREYKKSKLPFNRME